MKKTLISEEILKLFEKHSALKVKEIQSFLNDKRIKASQRGIYKELAILSNENKVVKYKTTYSLSLTWILERLNFYRNVFGTFVDKFSVESFAEKKIQRWNFTDLELLDRFWLQIIFLLFEKSISKKMYVWVPYFWFDLIHLEKDIEAQQAMLLRGNHMYMILGSDSYIDRLPEKYWNKRAYTWSYSKSSFDDKRDEYYDVIDDWIITVKVDAVTTKKIASLFKSIKTSADLNKLIHFKSFSKSGKFSITLEKNKTKADKMLKRFREFFG